MCVCGVGGIWDGATVDTLCCLLHPFLLVPRRTKVSPLGGSLGPHLCSVLGDVLRRLITGLSVTCCFSELYLLVTSEVLNGRGVLKTAYGAGLATLHL